MRFANIRVNGERHFGLALDGGILPLSRIGRNLPNSIENFIAQEGANEELSRALQANRDEIPSLIIRDEDITEYLPCVENPGKIVCIGLNYRKHAIEANLKIPESPVLFSKFNNSLAGHLDDVPMIEESKQHDYEAELGILIGRRAFKVQENEALDYVFGYFAANDVSARDLQFKTGQWLAGKTSNKFAPIGPYVVTANEVGNPNNLAIQTLVNGEIRQDSNTSDMIFYCSTLISYISNIFPLDPGDIILTGTPEGVILGKPDEEKVWLKSGDVVTVKIEKLGELRNTMK